MEEDKKDLTGFFKKKLFFTYLRHSEYPLVPGLLQTSILVFDEPDLDTASGLISYF